LPVPASASPNAPKTACWSAPGAPPAAGAQLPAVEQREMDHAVSLGGCLPEAIEIIEVTLAHRRVKTGHRGRGLVRAGQADDLVAGRYELGNQRGGDVTARAGNENSHERSPLRRDPGTRVVA
jgi:hypothetical protein